MKQWLARLRQPTSPRARRTLLLVAAVAFVAMGVVALRNFPDDVERHPHWWLLLAVGIFGPLATISCNALEYVQQTRMVGERHSFLEGARVAVLGTAANLLPLPGSMMVRTQTLATTGAGYKRAASSTMVVGVGWLGATGAVAGPALLIAGAPLLGAISLAAGVALLVATYVAVRRFEPTDGPGRVFAAIVAVEAATTIVGGLRLYLVIIGLGLEVTASQAFALTLSGALAAATGILPAGIGIREAVAAGIARLVDLPAAVGFVATAADRLMGLAVVGVISVILAATDRHHRGPDATSAPAPAGSGVVGADPASE